MDSSSPPRPLGRRITIRHPVSAAIVRARLLAALGRLDGPDAHAQADLLLLAYLNDPAITDAYARATRPLGDP